MSSIHRGRVAWVVGLAAAVAFTGCGPGGGTTTGGAKGFSAGAVRRTSDLSYLNSPSFGAARGRRFEDLIPVGARVTAIHVVVKDTVRAMWLSYEQDGKSSETRHRGDDRGPVQTFKLKRDEKIVGIHGYGRGGIDALTVATNWRIHTFGDPAAIEISNHDPWFEQLTAEQRHQYVGIGVAGRADDVLRQVTLRIQVQDDAAMAGAEN